ncbi:MAG: hypothetical protein CFE21_03820 [Bacteroidetes bacterium B1(2017)]|nr:MAG: hypothetical protein CFE21_03820 [Bacteroidetes bacterium B1(2017)]
MWALPFISGAQNAWESWDKKYKSVDYTWVLSFEQNYADSIEKNPSLPQSYCRADTYKITAKFMGKYRPISEHDVASIYRVFKLRVGNTAQLDGKLVNEYLFTIDGKELWLPIQNHLEKAFMEEVQTGKEVGIYCLFLNEHTATYELLNTLLISEFRLTGK